MKLNKNLKRALKKFAVKPVEIPESNGEQCNENLSYLKVAASTNCWLDFQLLNAGIGPGVDYE